MKLNKAKHRISGKAVVILLYYGYGRRKKNIQLSNVSIEHEVDWLQMAHFHAEWRKKFYDVIIPFITGA